MKRVIVLLILLTLLLLAGVGLPALAQSTGYDLSWWTVDGGGGTWSEGSGYRLGATAGQPDAGFMMGNGYGLTGGFWSGAGTTYRLFLPLLMRQG